MNGPTFTSLTPGQSARWASLRELQRRWWVSKRRRNSHPCSPRSRPHGTSLRSQVLQAFRSFPMKHPDGSPRDHGAAQSARHSHSAQQPSTAAAVAEPGKAKAPQTRTEAAPAKTPKQHVSDPAPTAAPAQVPATVAAPSQPTTQQPPRVTAEGHQVPIGNGGVGPDGQYVWTQTIYDTTVHVPVPAAVKSSHVTCTFSPTALNLRVAVPGHPPIALQGTLGGDVKAGDCLWTLEREAAGAVLTLALEKGTETWWRSVLEGHPTIDATRVDSTRQVTEYDEETQATIRKLMVRRELPSPPPRTRTLQTTPPLPSSRAGRAAREAPAGRGCRCSGCWPSAWAAMTCPAPGKVAGCAGSCRERPSAERNAVHGTHAEGGNIPELQKTKTSFEISGWSRVRGLGQANSRHLILGQRQSWRCTVAAVSAPCCSWQGSW